ncbi:hypothetical protein RGQ15_18250 [Paracoccus sp. MBLB3053]|uniref:Secreted protein n=1 Tax=Paracoccus aurantius TaxID=3073814 RepID=A0ABU2HWU3_9RHOB|nr:hypothetical protein [Paracoccus sp. MBLB3053]MDS9469511.1 hypothetical protein [Paracoccus sp. MBLB3053]
MFRLPVVAGVLAVAAIYGFGLVKTPATEPLSTDIPAVETARDPVASLTHVQDQPSAAHSGKSSNAVETRLRELVQQSTGTICETSGGVCEVSPRPINSPCQCGNYVGRVVR